MLTFWESDNLACEVGDIENDGDLGVNGLITNSFQGLRSCFIVRKPFSSSFLSPNSLSLLSLSPLSLSLSYNSLPPSLLSLT